MFGNNQIETLAKRVLRGEAEQSGRSSVPANDNAQAVCIDDRVSDLIDNPFCQLGLVFHGHAFRIRSHRFDCTARQDGSSTNGWLTSSSRPMSASRRLCRNTRPLKLREIADSFRPLGGRVESMMMINLHHPWRDGALRRLRYLHYRRYGRHGWQQTRPGSRSVRELLRGFIDRLRCALGEIPITL
jgi:hypothetical protein